MPKKPEIYYSDKYRDEEFEYRHVHIPKELAKKSVPKDRPMTEAEWRGIGIEQSLGWVNYMVHGPERHIILFRRALSYQPPTLKPSRVNPSALATLRDANPVRN